MGHQRTTQSPPYGRSEQDSATVRIHGPSEYDSATIHIYGPSGQDSASHRPHPWEYDSAIYGPPE